MNVLQVEFIRDLIDLCEKLGCEVRLANAMEGVGQTLHIKLEIKIPSYEAKQDEA